MCSWSRDLLELFQEITDISKMVQDIDIVAMRDLQEIVCGLLCVWRIEWHQHQWHWVTLKVIFAVWNFRTTII